MPHKRGTWEAFRVTSLSISYIFSYTTNLNLWENWKIPTFSTHQIMVTIWVNLVWLKEKHFLLMWTLKYHFWFVVQEFVEAPYFKIQVQYQNRNIYQFIQTLFWPIALLIKICSCFWDQAPCFWANSLGLKILPLIFKREPSEESASTSTFQY